MKFKTDAFHTIVSVEHSDAKTTLTHAPLTLDDFFNHKQISLYHIFESLHRAKVFGKLIGALAQTSITMPFNMAIRLKCASCCLTAVIIISVINSSHISE